MAINKQDLISLTWETANPVLTVCEAAALLRVGRDRIYALAKFESGFPCVYLGKNIRIPRDALRNWFERQANGVIA